MNTEEIEKRPKRRLRRLIVGGIILFILLYLGIIFWLLYQPGTKMAFGARGIALIRLEGIIAAEGSGGLFEATVSPEDVISQLQEAKKDSRVKAVLLRINSPGGTAAAGEEIYQEVKRLRRVKPVVVSIADVGASAAYLVASGATRIVATPSSSVGSIGTIVVVPNYRGLLDKLGIDYTLIIKGKYKDIGNPARPMTEEEKTIMTKQSELVYQQFIDYVAVGRGLPRKEVEELATGLAFLGSEAKDFGLVDLLGNYQDAIDLAAKVGKIRGEPEIIEYGAPSLFQVFSQVFSGQKLLKLKEELFKELQLPFSPQPMPLK